MITNSELAEAANYDNDLLTIIKNVKSSDLEDKNLAEIWARIQDDILKIENTLGISDDPYLDYDYSDNSDEEDIF